tara:strand:+ start:62 stop:199 length:138 start_codon:yes stop_codon:yes gene_type:complete
MPQDSIIYLGMTKLLFLSIGAGAAVLIVSLIGLSLQGLTEEDNLD